MLLVAIWFPSFPVVGSCMNLPIAVHVNALHDGSAHVGFDLVVPRLERFHKFFREVLFGTDIVWFQLVVEPRVRHCVTQSLAKAKDIKYYLSE